MRSVPFALSVALLPLTMSAADPINGRWTMTTTDPSVERVYYLDVEGVGTGAIRGTFVGGAGGQCNPILDATYENGELKFAVDWLRGRGGNRSVVRTETTARIVNGKLQGATSSRGRTYEWTGYREPEITDRDDGSWKEGKPVVLLDGKDASRWRVAGSPDLKGWAFDGGILRNRDGNAPLLTSTDQFWNFKLHMEYRVGEGSNSGVGLRGRYEIQILDDFGRPASDHGNGAVYGRIPPKVNASRPHSEWQTFDVTLIGRDLTVVHNGVKIIEKAHIPGYTAIATDPHEGQPGPLTLQGDHGLVEFRKIVVTPLER